MDAVRDTLINAGVELLERDGLATLTQRRIAIRAGVSHGAPRHHFPTYSSLLAAIARTGLDQLNVEVSGALELPDPRDAVTRACAAVIGFAVAHPAMFELFGRHDLLDGAGGNLRTYPNAWLTDLTVRLQELRPGVGEPDALALWAGVQGLSTMVSRRSLTAISTDHTPVEVILDGLIAGAIDRHG